MCSPLFVHECMLCSSCNNVIHVFKQELKDTKEIIRIHISKKNRQHKGQKKKYKRTKNDPPNLKLKIA